MTEIHLDTRLLQELIESHRDADPDMAEANVAEAFVARFFQALGWDTQDPLVWNRQSYVRGAGYADAALQIARQPVLFVEIKRFGGVARPQEELTREVQLFGEEPILSQAQRGALGIDRTPEEKQAMRYARAAGIRWAVLTNFERFLLFNADEERVVLAFDDPQQYLERADDLTLLTPAETPQQFHSRLHWYADLQRKPEIDEDFYRFLSEWRLRLAQTIYEHNQGPDSPLRDPDGKLDLNLLRQAVQRTLDRMIIIRYADDVGFLKQHDLLENELVGFLNRQAYVVEYEFQQNDVNRLYHAFYRHHNTTIFAPHHVCERVRIPNDTLVELVREISAISFRKFSSDILGNTYESYLGQRLVVEGDTIRPESDRALRKEGGIYYTPSYIVRYIVDHTLGRWLYATADGRPDGERVSDAPRRTIADLAGLRVVDPATGSGSFLIYAFEVLADFYEGENQRIREENAARWDAWGKQAMKEGMFGRENEAPELEEPAPDYVSRILQEHLYGVDLDPEAVEIAGVNLILRAFDRLRGQRERPKLPLILGQNLKVGNSLISGVGDAAELAPFEEERRQLVALRHELADLDDDEARAAKLAEIESVAAPVNGALNESLEAYFDDVEAKRPFNWEIAFPEVFDPDQAEEKQGFGVVVGNPPYIRVQSLVPEDRAFLSDNYETPYYNYDIYIPFVERSVEVLREEGDLGFILPNKFFRLRYGVKLRQKLADESLVSAIVDFGSNQVFQGQTTYTCLLFLRKARNPTLHYFEIPAVSLVDAEIPELLEQTTGADCDFTASFRPDWFSQDVWVFATGVEANILHKAGQGATDLGSVAEGIFVGIQTSADDVYILERLGRTDEGLVSARSRASGKDVQLEADLLRPLASGEDVGRYQTISSTKLLLFPYQVGEQGTELLPADAMRQLPRTWSYLKEHEERLRGREGGRFDHDEWYRFGRHQNLDRQEFPKLVVPRLVEQLSFTYDKEGRFYLDNVDVNGIMLANGMSPFYLLAVLNSSLIDYLFKKGSVPFRGNWYSANRQFTEVLPIRVLHDEHASDVAAHDGLVELAQRMLDLNETHQAVTDAFAEALQGYERSATPLQGFLTEQKDYVLHRALIDANDEGEVNAIEVDGDADGLLIRAQIEGTWQDVVGLQIQREDLRLYLLLALRAFLHESRRKRVWSRGKALGGVLEALVVPRLASATPEEHQRRVAELMGEVRRRLPGNLPHQSTGLDHQGSPLDLSGIEARLEATDKEIDRRVYELYRLTEEEIAIVEGERRG